ncbi:MAG: DNA-deoxyinosine glycosylase [Clostridia bacterium]|nr:DNA-deoxyinosine glycosylase [Clostridia bacterium]
MSKQYLAKNAALSPVSKNAALSPVPTLVPTPSAPTVSIDHPFEPIYDSKSKVLILGTLPSQKSRELGFYYAHPTNQFWRLIGEVCGRETPPRTVEEKKQMLLDNGIALWDVFGRAAVSGSSDASIRRGTSQGVNIDWIKNTRIGHVFVNGKKALEGYNWYLRDQTGIDAICLPSSSAANAGMTYEKKLAEWMAIRRALK